MRMLESNGPKIESCGTPGSTFSLSLKELLILQR